MRNDNYMAMWIMVKVKNVENVLIYSREKKLEI